MPTISVQELRELLASDATFACIDVRERGEFGIEQIDGVTPLPRGTLEYRAHSMIPSLAIPTMVMCDDGRRSTMAAETLGAMGFEDVRVLEGGLHAWKAAGLPTGSGWGVRGKLYGERIAVDRDVPQMTADELAELRRLRRAVTVV